MGYFELSLFQRGGLVPRRARAPGGRSPGPRSARGVGATALAEQLQLQLVILADRGVVADADHGNAQRHHQAVEVRLVARVEGAVASSRKAYLGRNRSSRANERLLLLADRQDLPVCLRRQRVGAVFEVRELDEVRCASMSSSVRYPRAAGKELTEAAGTGTGAAAGRGRPRTAAG